VDAWQCRGHPGHHRAGRRMAVALRGQCQPVRGRVHHDVGRDESPGPRLPAAGLRKHLQPRDCPFLPGGRGIRPVWTNRNCGSPARFADQPAHPAGRLPHRPSPVRPSRCAAGQPAPGDGSAGGTLGWASAHVRLPTTLCLARRLLALPQRHRSDRRWPGTLPAGLRFGLRQRRVQPGHSRRCFSP